ncbi:CHAD domain-containing protein [Deminuibacter soli]|uniref:CHAD domain-containing protein n=1 Tax=Deminuibacter soli TaxID=2291815 RepID=A0A3E1NEU3_9BACT|nr:CHAD domain-containing protein [Deminuibacter soli]RFM26298.1 CHAD domain-containing protein [Deminuibacter soli]
MEQQTPLQKYFAQRVKNVFNHLHDFDLNGDDTSLHDFRVEMKKLRAVVKFLQQVYPKQKLKRPAHLLRAVFQEAGEIREYQLLQQWLEKHRLKAIQEHYFPALRLEQMMMAFRLRSDHYQADFKEIIEHSAPFVASTNEILAEQYFVDLNAHLQEMTNGDLPATEWHELRKRIKQWLYAINWIRPEEAAEKEPSLSYYNKLQEQIGQWHDLEMIRDSFAQKQIYLSQDIDVQKDFNIAAEKLNHSMRYRERQIEEMLSRQAA